MARLACRLTRVRSVAVLTGLTAAILGGVAAPSLGLNLAQNAIVSANPVDWTPNVMDGKVEAFAQVGGDIVVGGTFTTVRNAGTSTDITRYNIFAYDATTGRIDPNFIPAVNGDVDALAAAPDGASVFAGGYFSSVNGVSTKGLTKLNVATGQSVTAFSAKTNSNVRSIALRGSKLYVAGAFTSIKGVARTDLAAVDVQTGAVDPNLNLPVTGTHHGAGTTTLLAMDVTPDASHMIVIGNFSAVGGVSRVQIAMIDLTTVPASVANWETDAFKGLCSSSFATYMRGVDVSPDGSYFVIVTTGSGYYPTTLCDSAQRWETNATGNGLQPTWIDFTGGDTLYSAAITGSTIYVAGHQRWENGQAVGDRATAGAVSRPGIAALDPINGMPYRWNPTKTRGVGTFALVATPTGLLEGSDTTELGGEYHARMGMFPLAGGEVPPVEAAPTLPGSFYEASQSNQLSSQSFDGTSLGSAQTVSTPGVDWSQARGTFELAGTLYAGWSNGELYGFPFDGTNIGSGTDEIVAANYVNGHWISFSNATGMFWDSGRLYYTRSGDSHLYYRYFAAESSMIGSVEFTASGNGDGLNWSGVRGMTEAGGFIFYATFDGNLHRIGFSGGQPVPGTDQVIAGPGIDGRDYRTNGMFLLGQGDTTPPTVPGQPAGVSPTTGVIDLSWAASSDPDNATLTYHVYRDGGSTPIGTVTSSSTTTVPYTDAGLLPGSTHTYAVDATDGTNTSAQSPPSDPITVQTYVFADDFSGGFAAWTNVTNLTLDSGSFGASPPSALASVSGAQAYAYHNLGSAYTTLCSRVAMNVSSIGSSSVTLLRYRTASSASIGRLYVTSSRLLYIRADIAGVSLYTGATVPAGWNRIELCTDVDPSGSWTLYVNGSLVGSWAADNGSTGVSRIQIGDTASVAETANFDDVVVDVTHIG